MRSLVEFLRSEHGAVTIEFVTLVPAFVFVMILITDASIIYYTRSEMWNVARDVARRMSTGEFQTPEEVRQYAGDHLFLGDRTYFIEPNFGGNMNVRIALAVSQAGIFGSFFKPLFGRELLADVTMRKEPMIQ
jgi:hypothetical protein